MLRLKKLELDHAKQAIEHHGYSTLLPMPAEWEDLANHWSDIRAGLCNIDLERYEPRRPIVITAAKNEKSARRLHLLHPEDMLIYTSMVLIVKDDIEAARLPRTDQRVYSYQASCCKNRIYDTTQHLYENYIERLRIKAKKGITRYVGVSDISNFYPSISQRKLGHLLLSTASTPRRREIATLLTSVFVPKIMAHEGRGIPTGPFASRLLAEVLLNDLDRWLIAKGVDFVRWVDDFNFFTSSFASAQRAIFELSRWLFNEHELTLQPAKTHILKVEDYSKTFLSNLNNRLSGREEILSLLLEAGGYGIDGNDEDSDLNEFMDDMHAVELLEMLVEAIAGGSTVDYRVVDFAVRRLRRVSLEPQLAEEILEILVENVEVLSPVVENVSKLISVLVPISAQRRRRVASRLLRSASKLNFIDHHAVWILTVFAQDERWGGEDQLVKLFMHGESDAVRRYAALAIAKICPEDLPLSKDDFAQATPLVRLPMLKAWASAPRHGQPPRWLGRLKGKLEMAVAGSLDQ